MDSRWMIIHPLNVADFLRRGESSSTPFKLAPVTDMMAEIPAANFATAVKFPSG
jgi:hypothetical protein